MREEEAGGGSQMGGEMGGGLYSSSDPATLSAGTSIDADKGIPDADKGTPDASLPSAMEAAKGTPDVDALEAAKGTTAKVLLATDVEAGKGTTALKSPRTDVDPAGTNTTELSADNIDDSTGELPAAVTAGAAPSPPIPGVAVPLALEFDIKKAETLIGEKDWQGIDDLLCKFLGDFLGKDSKDVVTIHPGLLLIPREEKVMELIQNNAIHEATIFFEEFIEPLKKWESEFKPLSLEWRIADLTMFLKERSAPTRSNVDVGRAIADYMYLYFPRAMCDETNHVKQGPWQFAMKLPRSHQTSSTSKRTNSKHGYRCLACGWTVKGTQSITGLKNHIVHARDVKCCPNVTQNMLDRLKLIDNAKDVPDLNTIATLVKNKKRKGAYLGLAANQNTGSSPSAAGQSLSPVVRSSKKLKVTPRTESQSLAWSLEEVAEVLVANATSCGLDKLVIKNLDILRGIVGFLSDIPALDPDARKTCLNKAIELERLAFDLRLATLNSKPHASLSAQNDALAESEPSSEMPPKNNADASSRLLANVVSENVRILRGIADFMLEIEVSLDPDAIKDCRNKAIELEKVAFELKVATINSRPRTSLPAQINALSESGPRSGMPAQNRM